MNKAIVSWVAACLMIGVSQTLSAQTAFQVRGDFKDKSFDGEKASLAFYNGTKKVYRSAVIKDGKFEIKDSIGEPALATLTVNTTKKMREANPWIFSEKCSFFIEGGMVTVEGNGPEHAKITSAGQSQKDYLALQAKLKPFHALEKTSYNNMLQASIARDSVAVARHKAVISRSKEQIDSVELVFLQANPSSHVTLQLFRERVNAKTLTSEKDKLSAWYKALDASMKQTIIGKQLSEQIGMAFKLSPGNPSHDFVLNDTLGNPVHLSSFRGKYVLLDFWASWCMPCRAENPTIRKAYAQYKDKGFSVLGVSLERPGDRKAWVEAIRKDGLTWTQVACMTTEENKHVTKLYGIQSIPMNFLIDPQGKIVASYLRGEELIHKLEEIF